MIKEDKDYKRKRQVDKPTKIMSDGDIEKGKLRGVIELENDMLIFREMIAAQRGKRSKQIARTKHFSVLQRPDGDITGTFHFNPNGAKIKGQLSAEFWQAISIAMNLKIEIKE